MSNLFLTINKLFFLHMLLQSILKCEQFFAFFTMYIFDIYSITIQLRFFKQKKCMVFMVIKNKYIMFHPFFYGNKVITILIPIF